MYSHVCFAWNAGKNFRLDSSRDEGPSAERNNEQPYPLYSAKVEKRGGIKKEVRLHFILSNQQCYAAFAVL